MIGVCVFECGCFEIVFEFVCGGIVGVDVVVEFVEVFLVFVYVVCVCV